MVASNDDLVFLDDSEDGTGDAANLQPWRVLVVDDDQDVHEATRFALAHLLILGRPLELLHAHSAREALELLQREGHIAVILLDVVMESDDAGLRTVGVIREQLKMLNTRIILRTGQPAWGGDGRVRPGVCQAGGAGCASALRDIAGGAWGMRRSQTRHAERY